MRLKGRFVRVAKSDGSQDFDESFWLVSIGDMILFKSTVRSLRAADPSLTYDSIATAEYGKHLLAKARTMKAFW
jgi:hypothetical protein